MEDMTPEHKLDLILTKLENAVQKNIFDRAIGNSGRNPKSIHDEAKLEILQLITDEWLPTPKTPKPAADPNPKKKKKSAKKK